MTGRRRGIGALGALLVAALAVVAPAALPRAQAAGALDVVAVLDQAGGTRAVVAEVTPAPAATLPANAAAVSVDGAEVPATVTPLLAADAPVALVIDTTATGAGALPQRLSAAAGMLLQLPPSTPVSVVLDRSPPQILAERTTPAAALHALATVTAGGSGSTAQAVAQATASMATPVAPAASAVVVMLGTAQPAPSGNAAADLATRLRTGRVVLGLVTDPSAVGGGWSALARATGGAEAGAPPEGTPDAVDALTSDLRNRYVVRFTPPAGAASAHVTLTANGDDFAADVSLTAAGNAAPNPPAVTAAPQAAPAPDAASTGGSRGPFLALLAVVALAVLGAAFLLTRRRRALAGHPEPVASSFDAPPVVTQPVVAEEAASAEPEVAEPVAAEEPTAEPEPVAAEPEPVAAEPEPVAAEPEPEPERGPEVAEPVAAEEPVAEPVAAEEPVAEPVAAEEPVTEPMAAEEPAEATSEPEIGEPEPEVAEPVVAEEPVAEPVAAEEPAEAPPEPEMAEPVAEPEVAEPEVAERVAAAPVAEPVVTESTPVDDGGPSGSASEPATGPRRSATRGAPAAGPPVRGVRYFDLSDPHRPKEITPSTTPSGYVGKHRQAGVREVDVPVDEDADADDASESGGVDEDADAPDSGGEHARTRTPRAG